MHLTLCLFAGIARGQAFTIPVVVHVLWSSPIANISDFQVMDGLNILNQGFNSDTLHHVDPPYDALATSMDISFCLATVAPDGTPTTGIDRIQTPQATHGGIPASYMNQWPPDRYFNIWVVQNLEFGVFPGTLLPAEADTAPAMDGVMMMHDMMGTIGTSTQLHGPEIILQTGRYLGLKLLWEMPIAGGPCGDDGIADTPPMLLTLDCDLGSTDGCAGNLPAMVENYMTYSYCQRMFTSGQRDFVYAMLNSPLAQRNNLWTAANLALSGCGPQAVEGLSGNQQFEVLPQPGWNRWTVAMPASQSLSLCLLDAGGQLLRTWPSQSSNLIIDLANMAPGMYVLKAMQQDGTLHWAKLMCH